METNIKKTSELSKLLSVKTRMSDETNSVKYRISLQT